MHGWETSMLLKHYSERGVSKAELSRRFGVDRPATHRWVSGGQSERELEGGTQYKARLPEYPRLCEAALRGRTSRGVHGRVRAGEGVCAGGRPWKAEEEAARSGDGPGLLAALSLRFYRRQTMAPERDGPSVVQ